jgi:hypothetical protein
MGLVQLGCGGLAQDPERDEVIGTTRLDQLLQALRADIEAAPAEERRFYRYVTLMDRHDAYAAALASPSLRRAVPVGSTCDFESAVPYDLCDVLSGETSSAANLYRLESERHAISKAANSFSRQPRSVIPRAVDDARLIYRLDLRDYGWATPLSVEGREYGDGWEAIVAQAKQAVEVTGEDADALKDATGAAVPFLLSHVFIDSAARGDVYYGLLRLPPTLTALEREFGVAGSLAGTGIQRALTETSGVSYQRRVLERRPMGDGSLGYWLAYDFFADENAEPVFSDPLGTIRADAMHAMFPLPNGLLAFYSTDADGQRIGTSLVLESPPDVDKRAHNAASCFGCHQRGTIQFRDDLLPRLDAEGGVGYRERESIAEVYGSLRALNRALSDDTDAYGEALARVGLSLDERDPISIAYFEFQTLHRFAAAGELFVSAELLGARLGDLPPAIGALATDTATVGRERFASAYQTALCTLLGKARNRPVGCPWALPAPRAFASIWNDPERGSCRLNRRETRALATGGQSVHVECRPEARGAVALLR